MPPKLRFLIFLAGTLLLLTSGCATTRGGFESGWFVRPIKLEGPEGSSSQTLLYRTAKPNRGWGEGKAPPGDFAFYNPALGATVFANSSCGSKYDDSPLAVLSNHLTMGFEDVEQVAEAEGMLSNRGSLERISSAKLDGVPVMLATTVVKKDICVFDVVLISPPPSFDSALADYRSLRDGFEARFER